MKTISRLFLISFFSLSVAGFFSCEKNNSDNQLKGTAEFSVSIPDNAFAKSSSATDSTLFSYQVMVSVTDMQ